MNKTRIDWCDSTWNPVTGCLHDCEYCYAHGMIKRFEAKGELREVYTGRLLDKEMFEYETGRGIYDTVHPLSRGMRPEPGKSYKGKIAPYPFGIAPTFHRYRLDDYKAKKGRTIFVCSMADLFGWWVPLEWQAEIIHACKQAPQHRYLFLTKNPERYLDIFAMLPRTYECPNFWFGSTITNKNSLHASGRYNINTFLSIEPLLERLDVKKGSFGHNKWVIIGAETGRRKDKVRPEREWIEEIVEVCRADGIPVFMKQSLADIWGEPLIQEFPWEVEK